MALTVGLLAFLAIDATLEGLELAGEGSQAFGGAALVLVGAVVSFLALTGVSAWLEQRRRAGGARRGRLGQPRSRCSSRSASACTTSARAWRSARPTRSARSRSARSSSSASRCTTRPRAWRSSRRSRTSARRSRRLALLGLHRRRARGARRVDRRRGVQRRASPRSCSASAPGAIVQVIVQLAPTLRDGDGPHAAPASPSPGCSPGWR